MPYYGHGYILKDKCEKTLVKNFNKPNLLPEGIIMIKIFRKIFYFSLYICLISF